METFANALETGKFKARDFLNSLLQGFAKITTEVLVLRPLINNLFAGANGNDGLGAILNGVVGSAAGLFGANGGGWQTTTVPARAAGGPGRGGQTYLVGEHGPEYFTPNVNGSFSGSGVYSRASGGNSYMYNIDARGADIGAAQRVQRALDASQRTQQNPVVAMRRAQKRFPTRLACIRSQFCRWRSPRRVCPRAQSASLRC